MPYVQRSGGGAIIADYDAIQSYATEFISDTAPEFIAYRNASVGLLSNEEIFNLNIAALVVDAGNASQLISPNSFADGYTNTADIDLVNSTNLDTSNISGSSAPLAGYILPTRNGPSSVTLNAGMLQGNMTSNGGLAALVNGTTAQTYVNCAVNTATDGWFSIALPSKIPIFDVTLYSSSDRGFNNSLGANVVDIYIYGKIGAAPTNQTDPGLVVLGTVSVNDSAGINQVITSNDNLTPYDHLLVRFISSSSGVGCAEVQVRQAGLYNAAILKSTNKIANTPPSFMIGRFNLTVPTDCVLNTDVKLSFSRDGAVNRTYGTLTEQLLSPLSGQTLPNNHKNIVVRTNRVDVSGQPSGTNLRYWLEIASKYQQHRANNMSMTWGN